MGGGIEADGGVENPIPRRAGLSAPIRLTGGNWGAEATQSPVRWVMIALDRVVQARRHTAGADRRPSPHIRRWRRLPSLVA